jgi:hypothetical protein
MKEDRFSREDYYQKIARAFLKHQTSMFFLSPRDIALIAEWEKLNIPIEPILEGIERTFSRQLSGRRKKNVYSLSFCEKEILKAYAQHQERLVGQTAPRIDRAEKIKKVRTEIRYFLQTLRPEIQSIKEYFERALALLNENSPDETQLEQLDEEIDRALWLLSSEQEKSECLEEIKKEYPGKLENQLADIQRTRLIKSQRHTYRIPHVALFYY